MGKKVEECSAVVEVTDEIKPLIIVGDILHENQDLFNTEITVPKDYAKSYWDNEETIEAQYTCIIESDYDDQTGVCDITILTESWVRMTNE